jgi:hypothetical protein
MKNNRFLPETPEYTRGLSAVWNRKNAILVIPIEEKEEHPWH